MAKLETGEAETAEYGVGGGLSVFLLSLW